MEKLKKVRESLSKSGHQALIVPSNDPHFSEYVADYWKCREFVSGFTGSAGTVVITQSNAALWVDSRYYEQAAQQAQGFEIQKIGLPDTPSIPQWISTHTSDGAKIAIDGKLFSVVGYQNLCAELPNRIVDAIEDPFRKIWKNRPALPSSLVSVLDETVTGESSKKKITRLRNLLSLKKDTYYVLTALDEIAWLFNIRGNDVKYNPVNIAYALISDEEAVLFIDKAKLLAPQKAYFRKIGVKVRNYTHFAKYLCEMSGKTLLYNSNKFDIFHHTTACENEVQLQPEKEKAGMVNILKSIKNSTEIEGFRQAMVEDGVALVRFFYWLDQSLKAGTQMTEYELGVKLRNFRAMSKSFVQESFAPIVGYGPNAALPHYSAKEDHSAEILPEGFLLLDTGGQYLTGTTDITRTIHLSVPTPEEKTDYTLVLQGMIDLTLAVFPIGTRGDQLDILARQPLQKEGRNYGHGTGHGVGHFLNVHEGPQSIRPESNPEAIKEGMVLSNEPALYRKGKYGIRTENLVVCEHYCDTEFGSFLRFRTLTLCPIDLKAIVMERLNVAQRQWLNRYHSIVYDQLSPYLSHEEQFWLSQKTKAI